jgi:hypothetical protein
MTIAVEKVPLFDILPNFEEKKVRFCIFFAKMFGD